MMDFINKKAKEKAVNNVAVIPDTEVYEWAVLYFSKSNDKLGLTKKQTLTCISSLLPIICFYCNIFSTSNNDNEFASIEKR